MDDPKVITALLSLLGSLIGTFVVCRIFFWTKAKELENRILESFKEKLEEKKEFYDVYRVYADPLKEASISLKYRLEEILNKEHRAIFLLASAPKTPYNKYKFISTIYRLASVLGWIRAYKRERSYLDPLDRKISGSFEKSVNNLQSKLADGAEIEIARVVELINIWVKGNKEQLSPAVLSRMAISIENAVDRALGQGDSLRISATELNDNEKFELCLSCRRVIEDLLNTKIPDGVFDSRINEAVEILGIKEAWIFRDWQQAIGDFMIKDINGASRRFDVIGFREFICHYDDLVLNSKNSDKQWIDCIEALFLDLDVSKTSIFDARREQLSEVLKAIDDLITVLNDADRRFNEDSERLRQAKLGHVAR